MCFFDGLQTGRRDKAAAVSTGTAADFTKLVS